MKTMFPLNPIREVLSTKFDKTDKKEKIIVFTPLDAKQYADFMLGVEDYQRSPISSLKRFDINNDFRNTHGFNLSDILANGVTKVENRFINGYIESTTIKINQIERNNYKCFVHNDWRTSCGCMNLPFHEDGGCSWNCLMQKLKHPEYGIIYTIPIELSDMFNLTDLL